MMSLHNVCVQRLFVLGGVVASLPVAREPKRNNHCNCAWINRWTTEQPYVLPFPVLLPCVLVQKVFVAVSLSTCSAHVLFSNLMRSYQTVLPDCLWMHSHDFPGGWKTFLLKVSRRRSGNICKGFPGGFLSPPRWGIGSCARSLAWGADLSSLMCLPYMSLDVVWYLKQRGQTLLAGSYWRLSPCFAMCWLKALEKNFVQRSEIKTLHF